MIPEREREALSQLTMCARRQCIICKFRGPSGEAACIDRILDYKATLVKALLERNLKEGDRTMREALIGHLRTAADIQKETGSLELADLLMRAAREIRILDNQLNEIRRMAGGES